MRGGGWGRRTLIAIPYAWLLVLFLAPFLIVLRISLSDFAISQPPYSPVLDLPACFGEADLPAAEGEAPDLLSCLGGWADQFWGLVEEWDFDNYIWLTQDNIYWLSYITSLEIAAVSTLLILLIGYPIAYGMARAPKAWQPTLLMLVILPFWTSFLIRVYAWISILKTEGLLNQFLQGIGLLDEPLVILGTNTAVYIGIVYSYLPFMVLPLYATLVKMDESLLEAAQDLGCTRFTAFWLVTIPLSIPGIVAGSMLVFIPAVGEFVVPDLLGGSETLMIGRTLWTEFFGNRDWPVASAVAIILLLVLVVPIVLFQRHQDRAQEAGR
ncbi:MAG: ABC transporter permease subunit [Rhodospirillaceae bacterium]|nr:ABC transporter permease subunit [Rhodospirillaceae bacterium]